MMTMPLLILGFAMFLYGLDWLMKQIEGGAR
jgi:hypothetical protein